MVKVEVTANEPENLHNNKDAEVLFLYRTKKKKAYFTALSENALANMQCSIVSYHGLAAAVKIQLPEHELAYIVEKAEQELYNAKNDTWQWVKLKSRNFLTTQIKQMYDRLYRHLNEVKPKLIIIWNGHKWQDNVLHAVNKHFNITIVYFENGVLPKSTTMDFCGINALNSVPRAAAFYDSLTPVEKISEFNIKARKYKKNKDNSQKFKLPEKYLLVPFQKDRDSQILDNSVWIKSMVQFFTVLVEALEKSTCSDLHIVFREHPSAKTKYTGLHKQALKHQRLCFDQQSDLAEIIINAEAVVTINSTVGLESLLLGTKVITLGDAFYNIAGLTLTASSVTELTQQINTLVSFTPDQQLFRKFVSYLENDYVIPGDWKKPNELHFQTIEKRITEYLQNLHENPTNQKISPQLFDENRVIENSV